MCSPRCGRRGKSLTIYKICTAEEWRDAEDRGAFTGAPVDKADGFIHFSTGSQVAETARRHFANQDGIVLVSVDPDKLTIELTWEASRGGDLFPHLYGPLPTSAATAVQPLPLGADGEHVFPDLIAQPEAPHRQQRGVD